MSKTKGPKSYHFPHFLPETPQEFNQTRNFNPEKLQRSSSSSQVWESPPGGPRADLYNYVVYLLILVHSNPGSSELHLIVKNPWS